MVLPFLLPLSRILLIRPRANLKSGNALHSANSCLDLKGFGIELHIGNAFEFLDTRTVMLLTQAGCIIRKPFPNLKYFHIELQWN